MALLHLRQHVQPLQHPVGFRDQRLADVEARKVLALEQLDLVAALRDQRRDRRTGRTAADDDHVGIGSNRSGHAPLFLHDETPGLHLKPRQRPRCDQVHRHGQSKGHAKLVRHFPDHLGSVCRLGTRLDFDQ